MGNFEDRPCNCGNHFIVNRTHWLCNNCNKKRLHNQNKFNPKKRVKIKHSKREETKLKRELILKKDKEFYLHQFNSKPNICEECGVNLPDIFEIDGSVVMIGQYSHILTKGMFPEYRHSNWNCNRLCLRDHNEWEFKDRSKMGIYNSNKELVKNNTGLSLLK